MSNELLAEECWEWRGARDKDGYGFKTVNGLWNNRRVHRLAWAWANGIWHRNGGDIRISEGMFVLHRCDNPPCCNPAHLYLGTHAENMAEKHRKGRHANSLKTHCPRGHEYSGSNLYVHPVRKHRACKACQRLSAQRLSVARG